MKARKARRIRAGLVAASWVELFRHYPTFEKVTKAHRNRLASVAALLAFDAAIEAGNRRQQAALEDELWVKVEFAHIINRNFQETR